MLTTIVPLWDGAWDLRKDLPCDLGHGFSVRDMSAVLKSTDLSLWNRFVAEEQQRKITQAGICITHEYAAESRHGPEFKHSLRLLRFMLAHLRFIVPNRTTADLMIQGKEEQGGLRDLRFGYEQHDLILEDAELSASEIEASDLAELREIMPWIVRFEESWRDLFPLFISLHFSEKAYAEEDPRIRNLLRVMALEALVASGTAFGKQALVPRLPKFIGSDTDLYAQYRRDWRRDLGQLTVASAIEDVCTLRNRIAHGDSIPARWLQTDHRAGINYSLCYADALREAATSMLSLSWKKMLKDGLQDTFADKTKMESYFRSLP